MPSKYSPDRMIWLQPPMPNTPPISRLSPSCSFGILAALLTLTMVAQAITRQAYLDAAQFPDPAMRWE